MRDEQFLPGYEFLNEDCSNDGIVTAFTQFADEPHECLELFRIGPGRGRPATKGPTRCRPCLAFRSRRKRLPVVRLRAGDRDRWHRCNISRRLSGTFLNARRAELPRIAVIALRELCAESSRRSLGYRAKQQAPRPVGLAVLDGLVSVAEPPIRRAAAEARRAGAAAHLRRHPDRIEPIGMLQVRSPRRARRRRAQHRVRAAVSHLPHGNLRAAAPLQLGRVQEISTRGDRHVAAFRGNGDDLGA